MLSRFLLILATPLQALAADPINFYRTLSEFHAPAIIKEYGEHPKSDIPTNFDFDGDHLADNNWDNVEKFDLKPSLYYEVIETKTHYFITYVLFHPRDYTNIFFV